MTGTILVTQFHASQRDVCSLIRSGLGGDVRVVASHSRRREDILMEADASVVEPVGVSDEGHVDWILEACERTGATVVLASRRRAMLADARGRIEAAGVRLCCGAMEKFAIEACEDKAAFADVLTRAGIPVPRTTLVRDAAEMEDAVKRESSSGGVCVKPTVGIFGRGFWKLSDAVSPFKSFVEQGVANTAAFVAAYALEKRPEPFVVMEWLPGDEYSVDVACDRGEVVAAASRLKTAHNQVVATTGEAVDLASSVVELLRLDGVVNVQTKIGADGGMRVLEVNTRHSGGVAFPAAAGVNIPAAWAARMLSIPYAPRRLEHPVAVRVISGAIALPETTDAMREQRRKQSERLTPSGKDECVVGDRGGVA